jgi:hypothetical protein
VFASELSVDPTLFVIQWSGVRNLDVDSRWPTRDAYRFAGERRRFLYGLFELDFREFALGDRVPSGSV